MSELAELSDQKGRTAVVTGSGGLGFEVARRLAKGGADVIVAARNLQKGADAIAKIKADSPNAEVECFQLDLASLASISSFAARLANERERVDLLVNNAGIMSPPRRQVTADGFELQIGVNHLGHFALTARLMPLLRKGVDARIVSVTSLAHLYAKMNFDDLQSERSYRPGEAYCQSKLAQLLFALELNRRSQANGWGVTSNAAHPGYAATSLFENGPGAKSAVSIVGNLVILPLLGQSAENGAAPILYAAASPRAVGGSLYGPTGIMEMKGRPGVSVIAPAARDGEVARRLWDLSEAYVGVRFEAAD